MDQILGAVFTSPNSRPHNNDDFADRLSSRYTVIQLIIFSALIGFSQYVRTPMKCWSPQQFADAHDAFTDNYCWIKNTYYLPWDDPIPKESEIDKRQMITYYQWIPFILLLQAVMFYLPSTIWHGFNSKAGVDADNILTGAVSLSTVDMTETSEWVLRIIINQMHRFLNACNKYGPESKDKSCCQKIWTLSKKPSSKRIGYYLLMLYLFSKILYIGNVIGQLFLLNEVLSIKYSSFGVDVARSMAGNVDWTEDSYVAFPRVTLCDFKVRGQDMDNVHRYTVQCVLPVNIYNEKIYVFLWFWMLFVGLASIVSLLVWMIRCTFPLDRLRFVRGHVSERLHEAFQGYEEKVSEDAIKRFTYDFLQIDGVLLLRLIAHNVDRISTTEIASGLFDKWLEEENAIITQTRKDTDSEFEKRQVEKRLLSNDTSETRLS